ncbi:MAG TPA: DNA translocase FtsK 4TM domain-containing protein [Pararhodobacter sp.]|uniref:DNA translocase FtsK n=1 Tax=Pararhodobacter sp. TaxID=2127056 RepID=UPI002B7C2FD5|nr:DNA translocase FtsK 4TM domain-containing protein [Pararhodobacter sp.]HPD91980.1 DNA translocase FtsK 4TM domain-containing protein [Pararhodobacter sp.]
MASYPSPQREPLIDSRLQEILSQRGKELIGLGLIGAGLVLALILGSYSPEDPSWMAATDAPVHNALGRLGAALAGPLYTITGRGAWGLVLALCIWGLRLVIHQGEQNILGRSLFVPVAVAMGSVWLASLVPGNNWVLDFGLGGMFGDTVLAAVLTALGMSSFVANLLTLLTFAATVGLYLYVLGSSIPEVLRISGFLLSGLILSYHGLLSLLGMTARGAGGLAVRSHDQWQHRRETRAQARAAAEQALAQHQPWTEPHWTESEPAPAAYGHPQAPRPAPRIYRPEPPMHHAAPPLSAPRAPAPRDWQPDPYADPYEDTAQPVPSAHHRTPAPASPPVAPHPVAPQSPQSWARPAEKQGLLGRVAALGRRQPDLDPQDWALPDGELIEPDLAPQARTAAAPPPDRVRSRIAELMTGRQKSKPVLRFNPEEYPNTPPSIVPGAHVEPPLTAAHRPAPAAPQPAPAQADPGSYSYSHAFGFQPTQTVYPGAMPASIDAPAAPPAPGRAPATPQPRVLTRARAEPVYQDDDDDFGGFDDDDDADDDRYDAPPPPPRAAEPRAGVLNRRVVQTPSRRPVPSRQAQAEAQPRLPLEPAAPAFELPPLSLLRDPKLEKRVEVPNEALEENARMLESVLEDYGVRGEILSVRPGPVVTMYELEPAPGLKASRVIGLADDIARSMSALSARVSTVPGRSVIGIELPNDYRQTVVLREILSARDFGDTTMRLPLALGKDIGGEAVVANLAKMPHLLIAGTTGSGKSVAINTMILSLLYKLTPEECRLIMIDPKMLELSVYDGIPHLLSPVVTDPKKAVVALKWVVGEMEERYRKMSKMGVRNIEGFNGRVREALAKGEMFKRTVQTGFDDETGDPVFETEEFAPELLPFIVVIVDEMADLMMVAGKEIEACIQRLAQMARASGIHLIMATQRPSVDVITGTIKANFPTRISFQVTSKIDSRTILGEQGAEQLLGMGDMLYMAGGAKITRVHGPFVSDSEVEEVVQHLKSFGSPDYVSGVLDGPESDREADIDAVLGLGDGSGGDDALYDQAVAIVARDRKCSTSYIQRKLGIGYNKAARLVEQMEDEGVVSPANHVGKREILVPEVQ